MSPSLQVDSLPVELPGTHFQIGNREKYANMKLAKEWIISLQKKYKEKMYPMETDEMF